MADHTSDDTSPEKIETEESEKPGLGEDDENVKEEDNLSSATEEQYADIHDDKLSTIPEESESVAGKVDNPDLENETEEKETTDKQDEKEITDLDEKETPDNQDEIETTDNQDEIETTDNQDEKETTDNLDEKDITDNLDEKETTENLDEEETTDNLDEKETTDNLDETEATDNLDEKGTTDHLELEDETTHVGLRLDVAVPVSVEPVVLQSETHTGGHVSYDAHISDEPPDDSSEHAAYVERYRNLTNELTVVKHRNMLLQKKVLEHLKRRKLTESKTEMEADLDLDVKYLKQLQEFKHLKDQLFEEEHHRDNELEELRAQTVEVKASVEAKISEVVAKINSTADKLHVVKNAKKQQTEMVEHLTGKLVEKLAELSKLQLEHIMLRNRVTALQERKRDLEVCGDVLNLATYEQMRTENQHLVSKVEDRDEELQKLREKAMTSAHNLAHIRQKTWAVDNALADKSHQLEALDQQFVKMREEMIQLKKQREYYRSETRKLKQEAGLIIEPTLLRDYEQSADEVTRLSAELQNVRNSFYDDQHKLTNMRKMLQLARLPDDSSSMQCVQMSVPCQPCRRK